MQGQRLAAGVGGWRVIRVGDGAGAVVARRFLAGMVGDQMRLHALRQVVASPASPYHTVLPDAQRPAIGFLDAWQQLAQPPAGYRAPGCGQVKSKELIGG